MDLRYQLYYDFVKTLHPDLPEEDYKLLFEIAQPIHLKPKSVFVESGKKPENIYLLVKGVARSYKRLENGKEITKSLFKDMDLCSSLTALINHKPSEIIYETLTDCELMVFSFHKFKELCNMNIEILKIYANYLEIIYTHNEEKHLDVLSKDAKIRYLELREKIPNIENLIPQYQIASYLNITPVQLSRIRSAMKRS